MDEHGLVALVGDGTQEVRDDLGIRRRSVERQMDVLEPRRLSRRAAGIDIRPGFIGQPEVDHRDVTLFLEGRHRGRIHGPSAPNRRIHTGIVADAWHFRLLHLSRRRRRHECDHRDDRQHLKPHTALQSRNLTSVRHSVVDTVRRANDTKGSFVRRFPRLDGPHSRRRRLICLSRETARDHRGLFFGAVMDKIHLLLGVGRRGSSGQGRRYDLRRGPRRVPRRRTSSAASPAKPS